jgi:hypothetical protein
MVIQSSMLAVDLTNSQTYLLGCDVRHCHRDILKYEWNILSQPSWLKRKPSKQPFACLLLAL